MGFKKIISRYKTYEEKELARRANKLNKKVERINISTPYKSLARKTLVKAKIKAVIGKFTKKKFTRAIGNPYNVKFPRNKQTLKKIKKG